MGAVVSSLEIYRQGVAAYLQQNNRLFQKVLLNPELSQDQRRLLRARYHVREQNLPAAYRLLIQSQCHSDKLLEADRQMLLAHYHSLHGHWQRAIEHNLLALELYREKHNRRGQFLITYNLAVDYQHTGSTMNELEYLEQAKKLAELPDEAALIFRAEAFLLARGEKISEALDLLQTAAGVEELGSFEQVQIRIMRVEFLCMSGDILGALELSRELLNRKSTFERARIVLENHCLRLLTGDKTAFSSEKPAVILTSNEYNLKWELTRALLGGDLELAESLWRELHLLIPGHFEAKAFHTTSYESKAIFGRCLNLFSGKSVTTTPHDKGGLEADLFAILASTKLPLRKEIIIERLWKTKYSPDLDDRFYQLIRRARKNGIKIERSRSAYRIA